MIGIIRLELILGMGAKYLNNRNMIDFRDVLIPIHNNHKIRLGPNYDGGYVLAHDYITNQVYSYGVGFTRPFYGFNVDCGFELNLMIKAAKTTGMKINVYDGTVGDVPDIGDIRFHNKNVYTAEDLNIHCDAFKGLVKMDIEGYELKIIDELQESMMDKISQLCIEFHLFETNDRKLAKKCLEKLNEYFHLVHIHGNNYEGLDDFSVPIVIENTYVNKKIYKDPVVFESAPFPIKRLDYPNNHHKEDFTLDWWCDTERTT